MYIRKILILTAAIGLVFMGSFAFYVYKVMFKANTSFEGDFKYIYIKYYNHKQMKRIILIIFIFLFLPFSVHAKKAVFGYSGSYWEGYSLEEVNINEYKNNFSGSGKLKLHAYTLVDLEEKNGDFYLNLKEESILNT